ncbi:hypothetical protein D3C75_595450 [compost metagenome]
MIFASLELRLQIEGHLAAADHQPLDPAGIAAEKRLRQYRLESARSQVGSGGGAARVADQALGCHDHERAGLTLAAQGCLAAQQVEILCGGA